jgi:enediyne biosynthesis protein E4
MTELLAPVKEKTDYVARAYEQRSVIIENLGNGEFKIQPLSDVAQRSPISDIAVEDINLDGNVDLIIVGNDYSIEPVEGQRDAGVGLILLGDGKGKFTPLLPRQSAFWVEGDARKIATLNSPGNKIVLVTQNKGELLAFKKMNSK